MVRDAVCEPFIGGFNVHICSQLTPQLDHLLGQLGSKWYLGDGDAGQEIPEHCTVVADHRGGQAEFLVIVTEGSWGTGGGQDHLRAYFAHGGHRLLGSFGDDLGAFQSRAVQVGDNEADAFTVARELSQSLGDVLHVGSHLFSGPILIAQAYGLDHSFVLALDGHHSTPLPRSWARDVPIFDRGDVATRVPCGPRPDTRTPWVLSSCRASRMAGLPTPNCSARARSEGIRSPGLTVPVETISLMREATLPGKVVWETGLRCSRATPSSPVPVFFWGLAVPSSAGGVMLLGFLLVLLGRISFPEPEAYHIAVLYQVVFALQTQASGGLYLCLASQRIQVSEVGNFRLDEAFPKIRVDCSSGLGGGCTLADSPGSDFSRLRAEEGNQTEQFVGSTDEAVQSRFNQTHISQEFPLFFRAEFC